MNVERYESPIMQSLHMLWNVTRGKTDSVRRAEVDSPKLYSAGEAEDASETNGTHTTLAHLGGDGVLPVSHTGEFPRKCIAC